MTRQILKKKNRMEIGKKNGGTKEMQKDRKRK
jgi:hypothetical protein